MPINVSTVICDDARREDSGKMILIGVYNDTIIFPQSEWESGRHSLQSLNFVNFISGIDSDDEQLVKWWINDPDKTIWGTKKREEARLAFGRGTQTIHIKVAPAEFTKSGFYEFKLSIGARRVITKRFFAGAEADYQASLAD